jgi:hypothetical protein
MLPVLRGSMHPSPLANHKLFKEITTQTSAYAT